MRNKIHEDTGINPVRCHRTQVKSGVVLHLPVMYVDTIGMPGEQAWGVGLMVVCP